MHPLLDAAERMLDDFETTVENSHRFFRRSAMRSSTTSFSRRETESTCSCIARVSASLDTLSIPVIDFGQIAQPAVANRSQHLPGPADIAVHPES